MKSLDKEEFRSWLEERKGKVVGLRCDASSCPIAAFLVDKGYIYPRIGVSIGVAIEPQTNRGVIWDWDGSWESCFVQKVDKSGPKYVGVRGFTALKVLEEC